MPFKNPHPLYTVWQSMRRRCLTPTSKAWSDYGGRGIAICERWDSFAAFVEDMGDLPAGMTLERKDNEKGYEPGNCEWADRKTQQRNRRGAVYVMIDGDRYRAIELAEKAGVKLDTIKERAARGLGYAEVVSPEKGNDRSGLSLGGQASGAKKRAKTHCRNGHEFTPANTLLSPEGWRVCRRCHADRQLERNHRLASR
ncbi:MAG: hypothetical protein EOS10_00040 [Mesorhizobium sp.]|uniref:hypothetical protein n=1 Tax=Mesorhizobium sp. TaxID=1871066 RepID=UPI000FE56764|nr:hypothetical protein [Mesorhizobium sp.]RWO34731.1 MAG: hypothetical protein EOS10_00040 [Mesorhizobium sp.]